MKEHGLESVDDFWFVFYGRVEQILKAHGIPLSGWEEIAVRKTRLDGRPVLIPNPGFADRGWRAYVWNNVPGGGAEDLAYRLANGGYKVVLCPVSNLYFDLAWNPNPEERGLDWGGYVDLRKPFEFIPLDYYRNVRLDRRGNPLDRAVFVGKDRLTEYGRSNVLGIQGNLWSETLNADGRLDHRLVPKLLGLAERAWAEDPAWARERDEEKAEALFRDAWSEFVNVLGKRELPRLDREIPRPQLPDPHPRPRGRGRPGALQPRDPGLRPAVHHGRQRAEHEEPGGPRPDPAVGVVRVAAFDTTGRKGHAAKIKGP